MSGIAGWIDYKQNLTNKDLEMEKLSQTLKPRGVDEHGEWKTSNAYFVHRRLIVLDGENGKQPMLRSKWEKKFVLIYDGEIYNAEEIRARLITEGCAFEGYSSAEVILQAYMAWGERFLDELNGVFAIAIWNNAEKTLFLARDRVGIKPLYYHAYSDGIIFGSEVKTLLAHSFIEPKVDSEGVASLVLLGPAKKVGNGIFKGIDEFKPGHFAKVSKEETVIKPYWKLKAIPHEENLGETLDTLKFLVTDSIKRQLVSDVPICSFLSGGLDSSLISTIAASEMLKKGQILNTYSLDFEDNRKNFKASAFQPDEDAPWIERMCEFVGSSHTNIVLDTSIIFEALESAVDARDFPGMADVDSSLLVFCKWARRDFVVGLSGESADELFGGYPWYHNEEILFEKGFPWSKSTNERANLIKKGVIGDINPIEFVNQACEETLAQTDFLDSDNRIDRRMREMFMLNFYWFMQNLIDRNDRMSMASSFISRVPFCDHRIVEYAYNMPWELKAFKGREKGILRQMATDFLPRDVVWRKKSPFPKTHNPHYMAILMNKFEQILKDKNCRLYEILDKNKLWELHATSGESFGENWYGQLMSTPQLFAYLIQMEYWLNKYEVVLV